MSTLAAARADNFYFSKNYDPKKIKPKRSETEPQKPFVRAPGQDVKGSTIRYETPFHVRCEGCQNMIAKGVRFNAVQRWVGNFHSTKIYEFYMKCPQCPTKIAVRTDPENCEYIYFEGARRIFKTDDCTDETRIRDPEVHKKIAEDPFYRLQNQLKDKVKNEGELEHVEKLQEMMKRGLEDFELNRALRKRIRMEKKQQQEKKKYRTSKNLFVDPDEEIAEDEIEAKKIEFKTKTIKKEDNGKPQSKREQLKDKLSRMNPAFKRVLKGEIKEQNAIRAGIVNARKG